MDVFQWHNASIGLNEQSVWTPFVAIIVPLLCSSAWLGVWENSTNGNSVYLEQILVLVFINLCALDLGEPTFDIRRVQDFEALTPNLLARTIETVEGGGLVILLLSTLTSLTQVYSLTMDVHSRLRTESHKNVIGGETCRLVWPCSDSDSIKYRFSAMRTAPLASKISNSTSSHPSDRPLCRMKKCTCGESDRCVQVASTKGLFFH